MAPCLSEDGTLQVQLNGKAALPSLPFCLDETALSIDARLAELLSLPAARRILVRGRTLAPNGTTLRDAGIVAGDTLYVLASDDVAVHAVRTAVEDPLLRGFARPPPKFLARRSSGSAPTVPRTAGSTYGFQNVRPLPGYADSAKAERLLLELADDPGFTRVMEKHRWMVQCLAEMEPDGMVGVDPVCVLGYNTNKGLSIHLRLRTDDKKGFRPMFMLKQVLAHELAHNVHSEHNTQFFELMRQIEREARQFDWRQSDGYTTTVVNRKYSNMAPETADPLQADCNTAGASSSNSASIKSISIARRLGSAIDSNPTLNVARNVAHLASDSFTSSDLGTSSALVPHTSTSDAAVEHSLQMPDASKHLDISAISQDGSSRNLDRSVAEISKDEPMDGIQLVESQVQITDTSQAIKSPGKSSPIELPERSLKSKTIRSGLDVMTDMGFPGALSQVALRENDGDASRAADWLASLQFGQNKLRRSDAAFEFGAEPSINEDHIYRLRRALDRLEAQIGEPASLAVALTTLHAYLRNILKNQEIAQFRSINNANIIFRERVGRYEAGQEVMRTIGFTLEESGRWTLSKSADLARVWLVKTEIVSRLLTAESEIAK